MSCARLFYLIVCFTHTPFRTVAAARSSLIYAWNLTGQTLPNISDARRLRKGSVYELGGNVSHDDVHVHNVGWGHAESLSADGWNMAETIPDGYVCPAVVNKHNWEGTSTRDEEFFVRQIDNTIQVKLKGSCTTSEWRMSFAFPCHKGAEMAACEGACENSAFCAIGLTCFNRGDEWSPVPGCDGVGVRGQRYCHNESSTYTTPQAQRTAVIPDTVGEATRKAAATVNDPSLTEPIGTRHDALVTMSAPVTFGGEFAIVVVVKPTSLVHARNAGGWDDPFAERSKGTSLFWCAPSVEEVPSTLLNEATSSWSLKDVSAGFSGPRSWANDYKGTAPNPEEGVSNAQFSFSLGERTTASPYRGNDFGTIDATSELLSDMDNDGEGWPRAIHLIFAAGPTARVYVDGVAGEVTRATTDEFKAMVPIVPRSCRLGHSFASPTHVFVESFAIYQGAMSKAEAAIIYKRWMCDPKRESERETRGIYSRTTPANCVVPPPAVLLHSWDFTKPTSAVRVVDKVSATEAVLVNVYADTQGRGLDFRVDPNTANPLAKYATFEVDLGGDAMSIEVCATFDSDTASSLLSCSDSIAASGGSGPSGSSRVDNWFTMQREIAAGSTSFKGDEVYYNKNAFMCKPDGTELSVYYSNQPGFYYSPNKSYTDLLQGGGWNTTNPGSDATSRVKACADACTSRRVPATALAFEGAALEDCEGAVARYIYMTPPSGNVELAEIIVAGPAGANYTIMDGAVGKRHGTISTQDAASTFAFPNCWNSGKHDVVLGLSKQKYTGNYDGDIASSVFSSPTGAAESITTVGYRTVGDEGDDYSYKFTGFIVPSVTGSYCFKACSDDMSDVYINGSRVAGIYPCCTCSEGCIDLLQGIPVSIAVFYGQGGGGAHLHFYWKNPGGTVWQDHLSNEFHCEPIDLTFCGLAATVGWAYVDLGSVKCVRTITIESRRRRLALSLDSTFTSFAGVVISLRTSVVGTGVPMWSHTVTINDIATGIGTFVVPTTSIPSAWPANFSLTGFSVGKETLPQPHAVLGTGQCITAQYLYIDGSDAGIRLALREVEIRGPDGTAYTIVSGAMSTTATGHDVTKCFDGDTRVEYGCRTQCGTKDPFWAYFDLGTPKCIETITIWNGDRRTWEYAANILGTVLSLHTTLNGALLWSERVTLETCGKYFDTGGNAKQRCVAYQTEVDHPIIFRIESNPLPSKEHAGDCYCESQRTSQCDNENALDYQRARLYTDCANQAVRTMGSKCRTWGERSVPYPQNYDRYDLTSSPASVAARFRSIIPMDGVSTTVSTAGVAARTEQPIDYTHLHCYTATWSRSEFHGYDETGKTPLGATNETRLRFWRDGILQQEVTDRKFATQATARKTRCYAGQSSPQTLSNQFRGLIKSVKIFRGELRTEGVVKSYFDSLDAQASSAKHASANRSGANSTAPAVRRAAGATGSAMIDPTGHYAGMWFGGMLLVACIVGLICSLVLALHLAASAKTISMLRRALPAKAEDAPTGSRSPMTTTSGERGGVLAKMPRTKSAFVFGNAMVGGGSNEKKKKKKELKKLVLDDMNLVISSQQQPRPSDPWNSALTASAKKSTREAALSIRDSAARNESSSRANSRTPLPPMSPGHFVAIAPMSPGGTAHFDMGPGPPPTVAASAAAPQHGEKNWFYTDLDDVQHGPFTLVKLKEWLEGGHFEASMLICNGREGHLVELGSVFRVENTPAEETRIGEDVRGSFAPVPNRLTSTLALHPAFERFEWTLSLSSIAISDVMLQTDLYPVVECLPPQLSSVCEFVFASIDLNEDGALSAEEISTYLEESGEGIFDKESIAAFQECLDSVAEHPIRGVTADELQIGVLESMRHDPHGDVAHWLLLQLHIEADEWQLRIDHTGETEYGKEFYFCEELEQAAWERPKLLVELDRIKHVHDSLSETLSH